LLGNLALIYFPSNLSIFIFKEDLQNNHYELLTVLVIIRAISLTIFEGYLFPAFVKHFFFFVKKKAESEYVRTGLNLSLFNLVMIIWSMLLWTIKLLYGLASISLVTFERLGDNVSQRFPQIFLLYYLAMRTFSYVVDFLFVVSLTYLFHCQAQSHI